MVINMTENQTARSSKIMVIVLRIFIIWICLAAFLPALNPARISELISGNSSLFTNAISYSSIGDRFARALQSRNNWVEQNTLSTLYAGAVVAGLAILGMAATACLSFGNTRMRRLGTKISAASAIVGIGGIAIIQFAHELMSSHPQAHRVEPIVPDGILAFYIMYGLALVLSVVTWITLPKTEKGERYEMESKYRLFLMMLPFLILVALFAYLPLAGWRYAFFNYRAGFELSMDDWAGLRWFRRLFENEATRASIVRVLRNTFAMSGIGIATSWLPMVFAIFLAEIKADRPRRIVQTLTTIPNFISWVLVYSVAFAIFSTEGFLNWMLVNLGFIESGTNYLMDSGNIWIKMWLWGTWKGLGWSAIIYIAGISSIDPQLYEAATVDGAGRFKRMIHITVPGLMSTFFVLLLLSIANILSNGLEQYLVFYNPANRSTIEVLDLYIYHIGLASASSQTIPLATVVGMFKTVVSVTLLFTANRASKWLRGETIV
jgi:putative aldouronate transport system permease protein